MICNALIQPHLNYGVLLWGKNIKRIMKLQKWAVRSITSSKYNAHTEPLFLKLKLLRIEDIYKISVLKFYYKYQNKLLPCFFSGMFDSIYPSHNYETRQSDQPITAIPKTKLAESSIRHSLPLVISAMNENIVAKISTHSLFGVSNYAKTFFINQYKSNCDIPICYICNKH